MEMNGIHLSEFRNIKTLMGAFGFSDGLAQGMVVQQAVQPGSAAKCMHAAHGDAGPC
jgi:hypothetical protein